MTKLFVIFCSYLSLCCFSGCDPQAMTLEPTPVVPQRSSLQFLASVKTHCCTSVVSKNGVYYPASDGIHEISFSGQDRVFVTPNDVNEFWQIAQAGPYGSVLLNVLPGGSFVLSASAEKAIALQWISPEGKPLRLWKLNTSEKATYNSLTAIDGQRVGLSFYNEGYKVVDLESGSSFMIDLHEKNASKSVIAFNESLFVKYEEYGQGGTTFTPLSKAGSRGADWKSDLKASDFQSISDRWSGVWMTEQYSSHSLKFVAFPTGLNGLTDPQVALALPDFNLDDLSHYGGDTPVSLGGMHFVVRAKTKSELGDELVFFTIVQGKPIVHQHVIRKWDVEWSGPVVIENQSIAFLGLNPDRTLRLVMYNADGSVRLDQGVGKLDAKEKLNLVQFRFVGTHLILEHMNRYEFFEISDNWLCFTRQSSAQSRAR